MPQRARVSFDENTGRPKPQSYVCERASDLRRRAAEDLELQLEVERERLSQGLESTECTVAADLLWARTYFAALLGCRECSPARQRLGRQVEEKRAEKAGS